MDRGRLEAFSDGVFAVAITLLALGLAVAGPGHGPLAHQLEQRWPGFVAYLISFFTIGIIWVNHHALVSNIRIVSRPIMFLNLVLLMFVVLVPFTTGTVAEYLADGGLRRAGRRRGLRRRAAGDVGRLRRAMLEWSLGRGAYARARCPGTAAGLARVQVHLRRFVYLAVIGIAFLSAPLALGPSGAVAVYYMFERTPRVPEPERDPGRTVSRRRARGSWRAAAPRRTGGGPGRPGRRPLRRRRRTGPPRRRRSAAS